MKRKEIEFDAEMLVGSVEAMAAHVCGERKLTLRSHVLTLPEPIAPVRPKDVVARKNEICADAGLTYGQKSDPQMDCQNQMIRAKL